MTHPHNHTHTQEKTDHCDKWELAKREHGSNLQKLRSKEAQILGQQKQLEEELFQVRVDIASIIGGIRAGDIALSMYWEEQAETVAKQEKEKPANKEENDKID